MKTLHQCLLDHPLELLQGISELREVELTGHLRQEAVEQLAAALADPASIAAAVATCSPSAKDALRVLLRCDGSMNRHAFARRFGTIRPFGGGRMAREAPWRAPINPSEELWYRGLVYRGFAPLESGTADIIMVPIDVIPHIPLLPAEPPRFELSAAPEPRVVCHTEEPLLEDACTLLSFVQEKKAWVDHRGLWQEKSLLALNERLLRAADADTLNVEVGGDALSLIDHLAQSLGWLEEERRLVSLRTAAVRAWLQSQREGQLQALWVAWRDNESWDDIRRVPGLRCEGTWQHDPRRARHRLLTQLKHCEEGVWYEIADFAAAVKRVDPDFQRPDGDYGSWYVRDMASGLYLKGFEHWEDVEGALISYILTGPAHWLGAVDLGVSDERSGSGGERMPSQPRPADLFRITSTGAALLGHARERPADRTVQSIRVLPDLRILAPHGTPCFDRFRLGYFAQWQSSRPEYRYLITQESLRSASDRGISPHRVLDFLRSASGTELPATVARCLAQSED